MMAYDPDILSAITKHEPEFIPFIRNMAEEDAVALLKISASPQNKMIVCACVWYALERGVPIKVVPEFERLFTLSSLPIASATMENPTTEALTTEAATERKSVGEVTLAGGWLQMLAQLNFSINQGYRAKL